MVILNRDGNEVAVFNLTEHNLGDPDEYATFKALLLNIAEHDLTTTTTAIAPSNSTTSTGIVPTSTTSAPYCPIEILYGEYAEETELLRYIRDRLLENSPEGQELIRLYYQWSPELLRILEEDDELSGHLREIIDEMLTMVRGKGE